MIELPVNPEDVDFVVDGRLQLPEYLADVSLSIIKTAQWKSLEGLLYSGGRWSVLRTGSHSAILIRHPRGTVLFDAGLGHNIEEQFVSNMPFWLKPIVAYENHVPAKDLLANELKNNPIQIIILSHLHWDHISGIEDFQSIEIWAAQEEYKWATKMNTLEGSFIKSLQLRNDIKWRFIQFKSGPYENFDRSLDVFQDGSVVLVPLPGHTPGSVGMFVNLRSGKRLFFTGDLTWTLEGLQIPVHKSWLSSLLTDYNKQQIEQSILKVHRLMREYPEMFVLPAHDERAQGTLGFYPKVIR